MMCDTMIVCFGLENLNLNKKLQNVY